MREVTRLVVGWVVFRVTLLSYVCTLSATIFFVDRGTRGTGTHASRTKEFGTHERRQYFANILFKDFLQQKTCVPSSFTAIMAALSFLAALTLLQLFTPTAFHNFPVMTTNQPNAPLRAVPNTMEIIQSRLAALDTELPPPGAPKANYVSESRAASRCQ